MKTKRIYQGIALLAIALATAACQNELKEESSEPKPGEKINMTIRATQGTAPQTRTSYEDKLEGDTTGNVVVKWEGGTGNNPTVEKIRMFGYADIEEVFTTLEELSSTPKSLSTDGLSITFAGTVTTADNYLAVYPAENCTLDREILFDFRNQRQDCTTDKTMAHLKKYDIMVGQPVATGTNNFEFKHKTIMLRFDLTLPTEESVTNVTLSSSITDGIWARGFIDFTDPANFPLYGYNDADEPEVMSLDIINHTPSQSLKAYMMIPGINLDDAATLTITVTTTSGKIYEGKLQTAANTELEAGKCYTLKPNTLTLSNTITVPPVTEGKLGEALNNINPATGQTELVLTGTVNATDITALGAFLKNTKAKDITTLDLSALNGVTQIAGFAACQNVVTVILPTNATGIGESAFEGCTALTTIIQNEPAAPTRASVSSRLRSVGNKAFKDCTSMTEMFLHANINSVGNNAFDGCTALTALVFEGTKSVGSEDANLKLGTDIVANTHADLKIFLPAIKADVTATTYKTDLEKPIYYNFAGYGSAAAGDKVKPTNYTLLPHGNGIGGLTPGGEWGK